MATIATFSAFSSRAYNSSFNKILPTGGNYVIDNNGAGKRVHVFTTSGTFTIPPGTQVNDKFVNLEVLVVGRGGNASDNWYDYYYALGGGGGGGAVIYDSAYRMPNRSSIYVTHDAWWDTYVKVEGLPAAAPGGNGGNVDDYSKGWPGGSGGGGSWHNAVPNGPNYSVSNPGWTYGNTGPAAPTNTQYFMPVVLNNPSQTASNVANSITKTWNTRFWGWEGNGQYGCTTNTPDSTKGLAGGTGTIGSLGAIAPWAAVTGTFYSPKAFRMRGGGGASYAGAIGGQGVKTDFLAKENGSYEWICAGGHGHHIGEGGINWSNWKAYPGNYALRDSGVHGGTYYAGGETWVTNPTAVNWTTTADNIDYHAWGLENDGRYGWGSGGSTEKEQDGQSGILILRYDLNSFPGGAPSAAANVFGGDIQTSANGRFRYHFWYGYSRNDTPGAWAPTSGKILKGTSANSQTRIAFDDYNGYRPRVFYDDANDWEYYKIKDGGDSWEWRPRGANTDPFYYYRDVPSFTVQYLMIGGGGASGTKGTADAQWENAFVVGGGGAGGMETGSFATPSTTIYVKDFSTLALTLANSATASTTNFGYQNTAAFSHKAGYVEVYANSLLNSRLSTFQYVEQGITNTYNAGPVPYGWPGGVAYGIAREQSQPIRIRGSDNTKARLLRRDKHFPIYNGYFGQTGVASNPDEQYLVLNSDYLGDPQSESWGSSIYLDSGYDHYYYTGYVRVRAARRGRLFVDQWDESSAPTDGTSDSGPDTLLVDRGFTLGTFYGGNVATDFTATATGTHPGTGQSYYNAVRLNDGLRAWSKASDDIPNDRWTAFYNMLSTYNASKYDNPYYWNGTADVRVTDSFTACNKFAGNYYGRSIEFSYANTNGTVINNKFRNLYGNVDKQAKIQWVEECCDTTSPEFGKRRFRYIDHWGNDDFRLDIDAGWKAILPNIYQRLATYTLEADEVVRTYVQVWRRDLRKIIVRQLFTIDVSIGEGGGGNKDNHARRRSGGTTSLHFQDSNTPNFAVGGGGAGGYNGYYWNATPNNGDETDGYYHFVYPSNRSPVTYDGSGAGTTAMRWWTNGGPDQIGTLSPVGAGGGAAWWMGYTQSLQQYPTPGGVGSTGSSSDNLSAAAGGGGGGGGLASRDFNMGGGLNTFLLGGATRGSGVNNFSQGRQTKRNSSQADSGHGGRGYLGGTSNWSYFVNGSVNLNSVDTYYYLNVNQFPHNAQFSAGGGGGAGGDGGDGNLSTGGNGGAGLTYSMTGYPTIYGAGGGGFGRKINGVPGSSMPADPSTAAVPAGAPDGPAYKPYGIGGGWSPGYQEGGGADGGATKYYPGSGPWPSAFAVSAGQEHMDALRYMFCRDYVIPGPQQGDVGSRYSGTGGVVIISYDRAPFYA